MRQEEVIQVRYQIWKSKPYICAMKTLLAG